MNTNIQLGKYPNIHWERFFAKFTEMETRDIKDWNAIHIIAYFAKKYNIHYGMDYTFRFNSTAPGKSYEVFQINKLSSMLSSEPIILKDYIDWFFAKKILIRKKKITSMAFLTDANVVNDYKLNHLMINKNSNIDRTTMLPPNYTEVVRKFSNSISTYGDLAFLVKCIESGNATDNKYKDMIDELGKAGMNISALDRVK